MGAILETIPIDYRNYFTVLGRDRIKALSYQKSKLKQEYETQKNTQLSNNDLKKSIFTLFTVGEKYTKPYIKQTLTTIYNKLGIKSSPKAVDIENYFDIKLVDVIDETGKRTKGFKILKIKDS